MTFLYDSRGKHIANLVNDQLHAPTGQNVGHFLRNEGIFIDMQGRYLGQLVYKDRLLYNIASPNRSTNYGVFGNYGNVGNYGNPGDAGSVGLPGGFRDVAL